MKPPRLIETSNIPVDQIICEARLRPVSQVAVGALRDSIEQLGLNHEILLRRMNKTKSLQLMAGAHRLEVFRLLGIPQIPAKVYVCTDDQAKLFEIDDNLAHAELDVLELSVFLAHRKRVYERMHPESRKGTAGANARWNATDNPSVASFAATSAQKMGVSERKVFRLLAAGMALGPDEVRQLRGAPNRVKFSDLETIARHSSPAERYAICEALGNGTAKSARDALASKNGASSDAPDAMQTALRRLTDAFDRAPNAARRQFVESHADTLRELLDGVGK